MKHKSRLVKNYSYMVYATGKSTSINLVLNQLPDPLHPVTEVELFKLFGLYLDPMAKCRRSRDEPDPHSMYTWGMN